MVRIGFDLDGVINDNALFKCEKIKDIYGIHLEPWQLTSNVINTFVPDKSIRHDINNLSATTLHPQLVNKNLSQILQQLSDYEAKLYIISRRGKSNNGSKVARDIIRELNIEKFFDEIIFCETDNEKVELIKQKNLDIFIDDRLCVIEGLQNSIHFPVLFDEYNLIKKGILTCNDKDIFITNDLNSLLNYAKIISLIENSIDILKSKGKINISANHYKIVSFVNNIVAKIDSFYLKIYNNNSTIRDNELALYNKVKNDTNLFKEIIYTGTVKLDKNYQFALFKPIDGQTLDEISYDDKQAETIAQSVYDFINCTSKINCTGFGDINEKFEGVYTTFNEYIFEFQHKTSSTLYLNPYTRKYTALAYNLLVKYSDKFDVEEPYIIPVDLNFKNIMITNDFCVKIVDPGALVAGPLEMSYGEFCAHSYGTKVYGKFEKLISKSVDKQLIRIYAIFMLLNILAFIVRNNIMDARLAKPFGNNKTFLELIDEHLRFLGGDINVW